MAFNKTEKADSPMKRRGGIRRRKKVCVFCGTYPKEVRFFLEESQATAQSIREL